VTLLTYPGWHDRKTEDHAAAQNILKAIEAKAGGAAKAAKSSEPSPEEAGSSAKS
jgi:hypothetical protein